MIVRTTRHARRVVIAAMLGGLSACNLAPVYHPPSMVLPAAYSGTGPFVKAQPGDQLQAGPWWTLYGDPELDTLERDLETANPTLQAAAETYAQARDLVGAARAGLMPELDLGAAASENKESAHTLFHSSGGPLREASTGYGATASWEPDFWGELDNRVQVATDQAQSAAADLASARLSLQTELASDYMAMRGLGAEHSVYERAIALYRDAVSITKMRVAGKIASGLDLARAENQLASTEAADTDVLARRSVLEHAVAVLAGQNPVGFHLPAHSDRAVPVPQIPVSVPSLLLQRRPDIAAAERKMAAASAAIGIARAAFYPNIRIGAQAGFEDTALALGSLPNSLWAVGASAMLPLFDGGLRHAQLQASWSAFAQTGDRYRATVLHGFQEVEDDLALTNRLALEAVEQEEALRAAVRAQSMALSLYTDGIDNYLNVTVAQIAALNAQIAAVQLHTRRLETSISLIGALGGGWRTSDLPDAHAVQFAATHTDNESDKQ